MLVIKSKDEEMTIANGTIVSYNGIGLLGSFLDAYAEEIVGLELWQRDGFIMEKAVIMGYETLLSSPEFDPSVIY